MSPSFIGAIYIFGGNFAMAGFALCQGQILPIDPNTTLFSLIGTTYGGDGVSTFALPDLRGRVTIHQGQGPGLNNYFIGQAAGAENVTLTSSTMPSHTHLINASSVAGTAGAPNNSLYLAWPASGTTGEKFYDTVAANTTMNNSMIGTSGSSIPFSIIQPVTAMNYVISLFGIFPSRG